jgi:hypothetical protein
MAGRGAGGGKRRETNDDADLEREEHCRRLLEIVDSFAPPPDVRAEVLRWMDIEAVLEHRDLIDRWMRIQTSRKGEPPPKRRRGRPRNLEAADLARGCARAWQRLSREMPPTSKNADLSTYYEMAEAAFALAGLSGWHKHAVEAANRVAVELEEQRPSLPEGWAVVRITRVESAGRQLSEAELRNIDLGLTADELRAMGVFSTPPRPRRGRKAKKVDFRP